MPFKENVVAVFLAGVLLLAVAHCSGCVSGGAEAAYTAAQLRCVDQAQTLAESRACRAEVDRQWGLADAGGQ